MKGKKEERERGREEGRIVEGREEEGSKKRREKHRHSHERIQQIISF